MRDDNRPGSLPALMATLDPDKRIRGHQFEPVAKWYLESHPSYRDLFKRVWLWNDWPNRPKGWRDKGIDLVAKTHSGELWAIQVKAYAPTTWVTKDDMDTFLSDSARKMFSHRLLITTTNHIGSNALETASGQEKPVSIINRSDMLAANLTWPAGPGCLAPAEDIVKAVPRDYQVEAIGNVLEGFDHHDRGQLIMACGTGKTLTSMFITEKLGARRVLVLAPTLQLLKQTIEKWKANTSEPFALQVICSDKTVVDGDILPSEVGHPVTDDTSQITRFLRKRGSDMRVVFCTYQSSSVLTEVYAQGRVPAFDLAIADEAHRCAGATGSAFTEILDAGKIRAGRRLFMTGTPRIYTGRVQKVAADSDVTVASMDDPEVFGPVMHRLDFAEAIDRKILTDYRVVVVAVTDADYRKLAARGTLVTRDGVEITDARSLAGQIGLAKAIRKYDLKRVITFHRTVEGSRRFAQELPDVIDWMPKRQRPQGRSWTSHVSGKMPAGHRSTLLQQLEDLDDADRGVLSNARCLTEGIDVPDLDGVVFVDPKSSEVDIVQAVGRAIRNSPTKELGTIVIPVFIGDGEDPARALESSEFDTVWRVIRALRSHDGELGEQIDRYRRELGRTGKAPKLPGKIHLDIPVTVDRGFVRAFDTRLVEATSASWEFMYGLLERHVAETGEFPSQRYVTDGGWSLGTWVCTQRTLHNRGELASDRFSRLTSLPGWVSSVNESKWTAWYALLTDYVNANEAIPPRTYVTSDGQCLGSWVGAQRDLYTSGTLSSDRTEALEEFTMWSWDPIRDAWEYGYTALVAHMATHGTVPQRLDTTNEGYRLGYWVSSQRDKYRLGELLSTYVERLEAIAGWTWSIPEQQWDTGYQCLVKYVATNHVFPESTYVTEDGYRLGLWTSNKRREYIAKKLPSKRLDLLEAIPGWHEYVIVKRHRSQKVLKWDENYSLLVEHIDVHGKIPARDYVTSEGYSLGNWIRMQTVRYRKGILSPERMSKLKELPGWTPDTIYENKWAQGFSILKAYWAEHGDRPSWTHVTRDGFHLGVWLGNQVSKAAAGKLDPDRQHLLDALIPGWTRREANDDMWEHGYFRLTEYVKSTGYVPLNSYVDPDGFRLGQWVAVQRRSKVRGKISVHRERRLNAVSGWEWSVTGHRRHHATSRTTKGTPRRSNPLGSRWENSYSMLFRYIETSGTVPPTSYVTEDGYHLGGWVSDQRSLYKKGRLNPERTALLSSIPEWDWDPDAARTESTSAEWDHAFLLVAAYHEHHGKFPPRKYVTADGYHLGYWVSDQLTRYKDGSLPPDHVRRLESIHGWRWRDSRSRHEVFVDTWNDGHLRLMTHVTTHGRLPTSRYVDGDGFNLGAWMRTQRAMYIRGRISPDRIALLETIPGWRW